MRFPLARTDHLVIEQLADETLIFDQRNRKAHCLNHTTALIWQQCDGRTDRAALSRLVERELGVGDGEIVVQLALEQLASRHLLEGTIERGSPAQRRSRRELLKRLAAAAVVLPIIMTVKAPHANAAASHPGPCTGKPDGTICGSNLTQICCSGTCCGLNQGCVLGGCCSLTGNACQVSSQCCSQNCIAGKCQ